MSIRLMSQVWEDTRIESQSELLVLLALADHARDDGLCWPSMRCIAGKARIEERSAQRIVRRLIEKGLIELVSQGGCVEGHNTPNRYRVLAGETRQIHGATAGHPEVTMGRAIRGDRESPRGDPRDTDGVTRESPRGDPKGRPNHQINHQIEPSITTTTAYPKTDKETNEANKPREASSSCRTLAVCGENDSDLHAARVSGLVHRLTAEFALSPRQRQGVREYCDSRGIDYVSAKAEIVRSQPRKNPPGALLAALREDWQAPVSTDKKTTKAARMAASRVLAERMGWEW